jgi:hypothetical protein
MERNLEHGEIGGLLALSAVKIMKYAILITMSAMLAAVLLVPTAGASFPCAPGVVGLVGPHTRDTVCATVDVTPANTYGCATTIVLTQPITQYPALAACPVPSASVSTTPAIDYGFCFLNNGVVNWQTQCL